MAKDNCFFSLSKAADKVSAGDKKNFLVDIQNVMGYKYFNSVYRFLGTPGVRNLDVLKYREITSILKKYGCDEEDWTITK